MIPFAELSDAALDERVERYGMNREHAWALRAACEQLQRSLGFCPRYHKLYDCFSVGRRCPKAGCEWTCWFDAYLQGAREALGGRDA